MSIQVNCSQSSILRGTQTEITGSHSFSLGVMGLQRDLIKSSQSRPSQHPSHELVSVHVYTYERLRTHVLVILHCKNVGLF